MHAVLSVEQYDRVPCFLEPIEHAAVVPDIEPREGGMQRERKVVAMFQSGP